STTNSSHSIAEGTKSVSSIVKFAGSVSVTDIATLNFSLLYNPSAALAQKETILSDSPRVICGEMSQSSLGPGLAAKEVIHFSPLLAVQSLPSLGVKGGIVAVELKTIKAIGEPEFGNVIP